MLSWRELPSGRVLGSSPVWYQTGTKVIALSEFFGSATQEHSYVSLTAVESSADAFTSQIRPVSASSLTAVESCVDTAAGHIVAAAKCTLSVSEAFADVAVSQAHVVTSAMLAVEEAALDALSSTAKCTGRLQLTAVESVTDTAISDVLDVPRCFVSVTESTQDTASTYITVRVFVSVVAQEPFADSVQAQITAANVDAAHIITLAITRPAQLSISAANAPSQDIKAGRTQCNLSASRSSIYLQVRAPAELSLTAVKRV